MPQHLVEIVYGRAEAVRQAPLVSTMTAISSSTSSALLKSVVEEPISHTSHTVGLVLSTALRSSTTDDSSLSVGAHRGLRVAASDETTVPVSNRHPRANEATAAAPAIALVPPPTQLTIEVLDLTSVVPPSQEEDDETGVVYLGTKQMGFTTMSTLRGNVPESASGDSMDKWLDSTLKKEEEDLDSWLDTVIS